MFLRFSLQFIECRKCIKRQFAQSVGTISSMSNINRKNAKNKDAKEARVGTKVTKGPCFQNNGAKWPFFVLIYGFILVVTRFKTENDVLRLWCWKYNIRSVFKTYKQLLLLLLLLSLTSPYLTEPIFQKLWLLQLNSSFQSPTWDRLSHTRLDCSSRELDSRLPMGFL